MLGKPRQALSARRLGWRMTPSAAAALDTVVLDAVALFTATPMAAMPLVAHARTPRAEFNALSVSSGARRPTFAAAATG